MRAYIKSVLVVCAVIAAFVLLHAGTGSSQSSPNQAPSVLRQTDPGISQGSPNEPVPTLQRMLSSNTPTHMDVRKNSAGCGGCHSGSGIPGTPLLKKQPMDICYDCHGSVKTGKPGEAQSDIQSEFQKTSRHPIVETSQFHTADEVLPELNPFTERHASCLDCHKSHLSDEERPWRGAKGNNPTHGRKAMADAEYEVCYLCHSTSRNMPGGSRNIMIEFDPNNRSYHPVEDMGKNHFVPSLKPPMNVATRITCSDCHSSDDIFGASGPHGSMYEPILKAKYRTADGLEDEKDYGLCYLCHERSNILANRSFLGHMTHIVYANTSCFTCHVSHGTNQYPNLIRFDPLLVAPSATAGGPVYIPGLGGKPRCYLTCHYVDHNYEKVGSKDWPW